MLGPLTVGALYDLTGGFAASLGLLTAVCGVLLALLWPLRNAIGPATAPRGGWLG